MLGKRSESSAGTSEATRDIDLVASSCPLPQEDVARGAKHGENKRKLTSSAHVPAKNRGGYEPGGTTNSIGDRIDMRHPVFRNGHRDKHPDWFCSHRGKVTECCRGCAISNLGRRQPVAPEMNILDRCVRARDETLPSRRRYYRRIVTDSLRLSSPSFQHSPDDVELAA
jgi:hypothetical protein